MPYIVRDGNNFKYWLVGDAYIRGVMVDGGRVHRVGMDGRDYKIQ
jgi:hypothetical protein